LTKVGCCLDPATFFGSVKARQLPQELPQD
jgi:hypothetical protein